MRDFFKINLGHVLTIAVWLVTFSFGYGNLSNRVATTEIAISGLKAAQAETAKSAIEEQRKFAEQLSNITSKMASMANDTEWIKRNLK